MCTSTHPTAIVAKIYKDVFDTLAAHGVGSSDLFLHGAICRLRKRHVELLANITPASKQHVAHDPDR
jgi:hypothetical protein